MNSLWGWIGFNVVVLAILGLDLGVLHRREAKVSVREAATWSAVWVGLSLCFAFAIYRTMGRESGLEFLTGYLIEYALSVDNIFVFVLIFSYFNVPEKYQHRVLFWGIIGALVLRGVMIVAGSALVTRFAWTLYFFGAFLVFTGLRMALEKDEAAYNPEHDPVLRLSRKLIPVTSDYHGDSFFIRTRDEVGKGRLAATPLFIVMLIVNTTDIIFATDPGYLRRHARSVHRLYLEHLRGAWAARALFPAGRHRRQVRLSQARPFHRSDLHRPQDATGGLCPHSDSGFARCSRRGTGHLDLRLGQMAG